MQCKRGIPQLRPCSTLHPVDLVLLVLVKSSGEFVGDDVAQVHQVVEALLQSFEGGRGICAEKR
jgi:hypothetical protein